MKKLNLKKAKHQLIRILSQKYEDKDFRGMENAYTMRHLVDNGYISYKYSSISESEVFVELKITKAGRNFLSVLTKVS